VLLTRLSFRKFRTIETDFRSHLSYSHLGRIAVFGKRWDQPKQLLDRTKSPDISIVCGGTSDLSIVDEIEKTLLYYDITSRIFADVGVAGLHRLLASLDDIVESKLVIAVAGMEAALPTVLAGLIKAPLVAVPAPVGYGVGRSGKAALQSMLSSCSPGVAVTNIGNGFGAAAFAVKVVKTWRN
jgi:NCAIR mutase (PurE)-related protein